MIRTNPATVSAQTYEPRLSRAVGTPVQDPPIPPVPATSSQPAAETPQPLPVTPSEAQFAVVDPSLAFTPDAPQAAEEIITTAPPRITPPDGVQAPAAPRLTTQDITARVEAFGERQDRITLETNTWVIEETARREFEPLSASLSTEERWGRSHLELIPPTSRRAYIANVSEMATGQRDQRPPLDQVPEEFRESYTRLVAVEDALATPPENRPPLDQIPEEFRGSYSRLLDDPSQSSSGADASPRDPEAQRASDLVDGGVARGLAERRAAREQEPPRAIGERVLISLESDLPPQGDGTGARPLTAAGLQPSGSVTDDYWQVDPGPAGYLPVAEGLQFDFPASAQTADAQIPTDGPTLAPLPPGQSRPSARPESYAPNPREIRSQYDQRGGAALRQEAYETTMALTDQLYAVRGETAQILREGGGPDRLDEAYLRSDAADEAYLTWTGFLDGQVPSGETDPLREPDQANPRPYLEDNRMRDERLRNRDNIAVIAEELYQLESVDSESRPARLDALSIQPIFIPFEQARTPVGGSGLSYGFSLDGTYSADGTREQLGLTAAGAVDYTYSSGDRIGLGVGYTSSETNDGSQESGVVRFEYSRAGSRAPGGLQLSSQGGVSLINPFRFDLFQIGNQRIGVQVEPFFQRNDRLFSGDGAYFSLTIRR